MQIIVPLLSRLGQYLYLLFLQVFLIRLDGLPKSVTDVGFGGILFAFCVIFHVEPLLFNSVFSMFHILKQSLMESCFKTFCSFGGMVNVFASTCGFVFLTVSLWEVEACTNISGRFRGLL